MCLCEHGWRGEVNMVEGGCDGVYVCVNLPGIVCDGSCMCVNMVGVGV